MKLIIEISADDIAAALSQAVIGTAVVAATTKGTLPELAGEKVSEKKQAKAKKEKAAEPAVEAEPPVKPASERTDADLREALIGCATRLSAAKAKSVLKEVTGVDSAGAVPADKYDEAIAALTAA